MEGFFMKRYFLSALLAFMATAVIQGCASIPTSIPSSYLGKQRQMAVQIAEIAEKPNFRDSGEGGLIGWVASIGRSSNMKEMFEGIKGETVKELLRQEIERKLEGAFDVDEESRDLSLEVQVTQWGWFLPTAMLGIKTGSYQMEIIGIVKVCEKGADNKEIARLLVASQKPLGNEPTAEICQQALKQAVDDFAQQAANNLLKQKKG
jgi:hypothetical protein